jgi:hypothetical protein
MAVKIVSDDPCVTSLHLTKDERAMTDQVFCYHCRRYHPTVEVTLVQSKGVKRWRCLKSLTSIHGSVAERDAFGKSVSESNRASRDWQNARPLPRPVLDLLSARPGHFDVAA